MLTLVAAVLVKDTAREMCDVRSSVTVDTDDDAAAGGCRFWFGGAPSRSARSWTRLENDITFQSRGAHERIEMKV